MNETVRIERHVVRVLVVDDSPVCRALLREVLEFEPDLQVVGEAGSGLEAIALARSCSPDVVTMDVRMPGLGGLETIERIMAESPCPVLVVTDLPVSSEDGLAFEATRRGALDVAAKPSVDDRRAAAALRSRVRWLASVPVIRHVAGGGSARGATDARAGVARRRDEITTRLPSRRPARRSSEIRLVVLAASAGGPGALVTVLSSLPRTFRAGIALVQHLPAGFAESFARFLASRTPFRVLIGTRSTRIEPGTIVLPPDAAHLSVASRDAFALSAEPPVGGHRPAADVLVRTAAAALGDAALGVVLSGIGSDGADGLLTMRRAGASTFAQDEATSAIYGMPRAALERGGAEKVLPLSAIADALVARVEGAVS